MGKEGSLTTDYLQEVVSHEMYDQVYNGGLDCREGLGWVNNLSPMGESLVRSFIRSKVRKEGRLPARKELIELTISMDEINKMMKQETEYLMTKHNQE